MLREDELNEFKKTTGELNEAMISISAILNKHGRGFLYFGLKNNGEPFPFMISDSTLRDVSRKIFEAIRPQIFPVIDTVIIKNIEVIRVSFDGTEKPYSAFGKYYTRMADEDRELTPGELRKIMVGKEYEEKWENRLSDVTVDDIDEQLLHKFYLSATECGRLPDIGNDKIQLLSKLGLLKGNNLTNAGKYLFSKSRPLVLKMAVFATDHKTTFLDIVREEGNIFQLIDKAMGYIIKNIRWSVSLSGDGIRRIETPEVPLDALREAVINSFAHARYGSFVQHEIDIFSNRIAIINPGSFANSYEPTDFLTKDLHSFLRNEMIARVLYLCKDVETFGSGIKKIYSLCSCAGVTIDYINTETDFTFAFSRIDRNVVPHNGDISRDEANILSYFKENPYLLAEDLVEKSGKSLCTVQKSLNMLKNKGILQLNGSIKTGFWQLQ